MISYHSVTVHTYKHQHFLYSKRVTLFIQDKVQVQFIVTFSNTNNSPCLHHPIIQLDPALLCIRKYVAFSPHSNCAGYGTCVTQALLCGDRGRSLEQTGVLVGEHGSRGTQMLIAAYVGLILYPVIGGTATICSSGNCYSL